MAYNFGPPKTSTFTLTSTTPVTTSNLQYNFGAGDAKGASAQTKPLSNLFAAPIPSTASTGFTLGGATSVAAPTGFAYGAAPTTATITPTFATTTQGATLGTSTLPQFALNLGASTATPTALTFGAPSTASSTVPALSLGSSTIPALSLGTSTIPALSLGTASFTTPITSSSFGLGLASTAPNQTTLTTSNAQPAVSSILPTGALTFAQLEDTINKWTVDLEEQGKLFGNQAVQLNAWDRLLISNGEKILNLNNGIERVKQQQQQLDQELDFILAQQKELEDCIAPLEKELHDIPITDLDRNQTYQFAENLDSQLKQMSEDLKEIIEHLNESTKDQELSDPVVQVGRILNAHMNSLQWIDRNTSQISVHLDQIAKLHDVNKRNHEINLQRTYD